MFVIADNKKYGPRQRPKKAAQPLTPGEDEGGSSISIRKYRPVLSIVVSLEWN